MDTIAAAALHEHASGLLERSAAYMLGRLATVTPSMLGAPTPCRDWDLGMLLHHLADSLTALAEALGSGVLTLEAPGGGEAGPGRRDVLASEEGPADRPVRTVRAATARLLGAWTAAGHPDIAIAGHPLHAAVVGATGALEIAVHGWDIARATGRPRPIPPALAGRLLRLAPLAVTAGTRDGLFAPPLPVPDGAGPAARLLAHLGREPDAA
ncbi:TIGR03086 family metal-binding protein [Spirillospora albida]|uniref:TIGR03086 family metal-binding protein n=1 Tax=Spirillospora albida TaxID=58123 RepID=UPI0006911A58|nr:TIGR03086 family metal-binding protein [Spirillospora albida]